jgi:hypothetical protein
MTETYKTLVPKIVAKICSLGGKRRYTCECKSKAKLLTLTNDNDIIKLNNSQRIFFVSLSKNTTNCILYDDNTNKVLYETIIPLDVNDDNFAYFFWNNEVYFVKKVDYADWGNQRSKRDTDLSKPIDHDFKIMKPYPKLLYLVNDTISQFESKFRSPKIFLSDQMYVELFTINTQNCEETFDFNVCVFNKNELIQKLDDVLIFCACNPSVIVMRESKTKELFYYCTKTHKEISSAADFICWSNHQAVENDKKEGGVILKEFVDPDNVKICSFCEKTIDNDQFAESGKIRIHLKCCFEL